MTTPHDKLRDACERTANAQVTFKAADAAGSGHVAAASVLMEACADLSTHIPTILALLDENARLRALVQPPVVAAPAEDTREWCWREAGNETCQGPFATRADAIFDARHDWGKVGPIEVGRCTPPMDALGTPDADDMRERVNDILCDEGLDAHAIILDEPAADAALREWFMRYVEVDGMQWIARDEETVWPDAPEEGGAS